MDAALGLLLLAVYIAGIVGLAAGITYGVIRIFPTERNPKKTDSAERPARADTSPTNGGTGAGALFRRAKRGRK